MDGTIELERFYENGLKNGKETKYLSSGEIEYME